MAEHKRVFIPDKRQARERREALQEGVSSKELMAQATKRSNHISDTISNKCGMTWRFRNNYLTNIFEWPVIAGALCANTTLNTLDLSGSCLNDFGARVIADVLMCNTSITELKLDFCDIGDDGAHALADALRFNSTLSTLWLDDNAFSDEVAEELTASAKWIIRSSGFRLIVCENHPDTPAAYERWFTRARFPSMDATALCTVGLVHVWLSCYNLGLGPVVLRLWRRAAYRLESSHAWWLLSERFKETRRPTPAFCPHLRLMRRKSVRFAVTVRTVFMCLLSNNRGVDCTFDVVMGILEQLNVSMQ